MKQISNFETVGKTEALCRGLILPISKSSFRDDKSCNFKDG